MRLAELGCYNKILPKYTPYLQSGDRENYQLFRYEKRRENFSAYDFPKNPKTMQDILDHFKTSYAKFAYDMCLQPGEIYRLTVKERVLIPHNLRQAFKQIGLEDEWIAQLQYLTIKTNYQDSVA